MYRLTYLREETLWWYLGMNRLTDLLLDRARLPRPAEILDAGCGTGGMLRRLARRGRVTGLDVSELALGYCRRRGERRLVRGSTTQLPFADASFDLVTSFDVLEMLLPPDHPAAFREFARVVRPGGRLLLRVPAYDWLRGHHDRATRAVHRFGRAEVERLLRAAGFGVERSSYAVAALFPAAVLKRAVDVLRPAPAGVVRTDFWAPPKLVNAALAGLLDLERALIRRGLDLPFGLSLLTLARRADAR